MAETSKSMAAFGPKQKLQEWDFELHALGENDIEMKLAFCGVCHSDIHTIEGEWGDQPFPIVPGHELIGYVTKVGSAVTRMKVGDRVGVGAQGSSCLSCEECNNHRENYCYGGLIGTYGGKLEDGYITKGGYSHFHRVNSRFAVKIPDNLPSAEAAPLLCAAITSYAPLKYANVGPGKKVGVIGIGGLGHLGVKLAAALGAHVIAISSSESKRAEASLLGAAGFLNHNDAESLKAHKYTFDMILNTVSAPLKFNKFLNLLKPHGYFTNVGLPEENYSVPPFALGRDIKFGGTCIGSPSEIEEMLALCSKHNITAQIELAPLAKANEAIEKVKANEARYRIVLAIDEELDRQHRPNEKIERKSAF